MEKQTHGGRLSSLVLLLAALLGAGQASAQIWTQLSPAGTLPSARADATAVYNAASNSMLMFGGTIGECNIANGPTLNDSWLLTQANGLGTPRWTSLIPNGASGAPPARRAHTAVYDEVNDRMTIFGGDPFDCSGSKFNDVWVLTNATGSDGAPAWAQLTPAGGPPPPRSDTTAMYDPVSNTMIVSGGTGLNAVPVNDTWVLTNANGLGGTPQWTQLNPEGGPPPATWFRATIYDPTSNRMTVFGGGNCCGGSTYNQVWVLTGANGLGGNPQWVQLSPVGTPPSPRIGSTAVYDRPSNRMIIFAGDTNTIYPPRDQVNGVWVLSHANGLGGTPTWYRMATSGTPPSPRGGTGDSQPTMVYDQRTDRVTIFGGVTGLTLLNDTWVLQAQDLAASPIFLTFSDQPVGVSSAPITVTLSNVGAATVSSLSIGLSGPDAGDFVQSNDCGTTLTVGSNCTITVTFTPTATGSRTAVVVINDYAYIDRGFVPLSGTGI